MKEPLAAVIAAFDSAEDLVAAVRRLREPHPVASGRRGRLERLLAALRLVNRRRLGIETYTPHPVEELDELLPNPPSLLPAVFLAAGLLGAAGGFLLQLWGASAYPINVGGRPIDSWPAFGPSTFELGALCALVVGFIAYLAATRLTRLYDPIFSAPGFERAAQDRYLLCVRGRGRLEVERALAPLRPRRLVEVAL